MQAASSLKYGYVDLVSQQLSKKLIFCVCSQTSQPSVSTTKLEQRLNIGDLKALQDAFMVCILIFEYTNGCAREIEGVPCCF